MSDSDHDEELWRTIIASPTPQQQSQHHHQQQQQQQPMHNFGKSGSIRGQPRRYGSIRVAECSFIEQPDDSMNESPVCETRRPPIPPPPPKRATFGPTKQRRQTVTQITYVPSPFDRFRPVSDDDSPVNDVIVSDDFLNVFSQRNVANVHEIGRWVGQ